LADLPDPDEAARQIMEEAELVPVPVGHQPPKYFAIATLVE
jgi:hypothetical protein